jgi:hypothetical protein
MEDRKNTLSELQEIFLWQELNGQLLQLKQQGEPIQDEHHFNLRKFCLDNLLFSKVTSNSLIDEIPLSLILDHQQLSFITFNLETWNNLLCHTIPKSYALNIEKALIGSFDNVSDYDRKYKLTDTKETDDDNDHELYDFIGQYNDLLEKQKRNFPLLVNDLFDLKTKTIREIMKSYADKYSITITENIMSLTMDPSVEKEINNFYIDNFVSESSRLAISNDITLLFSNLDLYGFLNKKRDESDLKQSIRKFIDHEINIQNKESELRKSFVNAAGIKINTAEINTINLCDTSAFTFLEYPLPII